MPAYAPIEERLERLSMPEPNTGCVLWMGTTISDGYGMISVGRTMKLAHRVAYELANGPIPDGLWVLHRCDIPSCINPDHLFLGTHTDNVADMVQKGRQRGASGDRNASRLYPERLRRGETHGMAKLAVDDVRAIRSRAASGERKAQLAREFGVTKNLVGAIVSHRIWKHVP